MQIYNGFCVRGSIGYKTNLNCPSEQLLNSLSKDFHPPQRFKELLSCELVSLSKITPHLASLVASNTRVCGSSRCTPSTQITFDKLLILLTYCLISIGNFAYPRAVKLNSMSIVSEHIQSYFIPPFASVWLTFWCVFFFQLIT